MKMKKGGRGNEKARIYKNGNRVGVVLMCNGERVADIYGEEIRKIQDSLYVYQKGFPAAVFRAEVENHGVEIIS